MGMRVVLTGMGGELGTRVTNLLEADARVEAIVGVDLDPPRGRIPRAEFHLVEPTDRAGVVAVVREAEPTAVVHLGVYEPGARVATRDAAAMNRNGISATLDAAAQSPALDRIVLRSGVEVYGRRLGGPRRPDETAPVDPTTPWGQALAEVEQIATDAARAADVALTVLRMAPVVGPHVPSPLGRVLRLPLVPVSAVRNPSFSLLDSEDAAQAVVRALGLGLDVTANVVGQGTATPLQAVSVGGRHALPTAGPGWTVARLACELAGAPLPPHVVELLTQGRRADDALGRDVLGLAPSSTTEQIVRDLYAWGSVVRLDVAGGHARPSTHAP